MKAVVFDMDGLIFDTERLGMVAVKEVALRQGIALDEAMVLSQLGKTLTATNEALLAFAPQIDTKRLWQDFDEKMRELFVLDENRVKPGLTALLKALDDNNLPRAICSSSPLAMITFYLKEAGLDEAFPVVISERAELRSKPAPDMFLAAAQTLGCEPADCLALEDSINGIKAARAAGMKVAMVPDLIPFEEELAPYVDWVLPSLADAIGLLSLSDAR